MSSSFPNAEHSPVPSSLTSPVSPTFLSIPQQGDIATDGRETRCWYYSPSTLQHERELLKKYGAEDFSGLLTEAHVLLIGMVKVMKGFNHDIRVRGYVISSLGSVLEQASSLVLRMQNVYSKVKRV